MNILENEFAFLDHDHDGLVSAHELMDALESAGLLADDPRLKSILKRIRESSSSPSKRKNVNIMMSYEKFLEIVQEHAALVTRVLSRDLVVPSFEEFCQEVKSMYEKTQLNQSGRVADYIPELACANADDFGVSICTVDGQRWSGGHSDVNFCVQSCSKPLSYCMAAEEYGLEHVHQFVGCEPSGVKFNEMILKEIDPSSNDRGAQAIPHNPMVNAGAIMIASILMSEEMSMAKRFKSVTETWKRLFGGKKPGFSNATYLSEKETAHRNSALGYMMLEKRSFPPKTFLRETLELYFQCCSLEADCDRMSVMAASLANNGVCPLTADRIFSPKHVRACLSMMSSCGLYDASGLFNFEIGLPAKSGVAGCIFLVVPKMMGISIYSPRLDENGNSVRAIEFCHRLCQRFDLHVYESVKSIESAISGSHPGLDSFKVLQEAITTILFAASTGDMYGLRRMVADGSDVSKADYDDRTPLHVACSNGQYDAVVFILDQLMELRDSSPQRDWHSMISPLDRWKRTPLDDALDGQYETIINLLRRNGAHTSSELNV